MNAPSTPANPSQTQRLLSLDALRGFDMFWILGADAVAGSLRQCSDNALVQLGANQLDHKDWAGFAFYDLIFPLFVFIVGVSLVFSLSKTIEREGRSAAVRRVLKRGLLLYLIGIFYYGGFSKPFDELRLLGVLQRLALCYTAAGLLFCWLKPRALAGVGVALLLGYWAMLAWVPFPDVRPVPGGTLEISKETGFTNVAQLNFNSTNMLHGVYLKGVNLAHYVDQRYLPAFKWDGTWDPEGLLSTVPAIASCLAGVFAGLLLRDTRRSELNKVAVLLAAGAGAAVLGWLWGTQFPVIKKLWTSSYVLVAAGYSAMLLAAFYYIVDVRQWQKWAMPFVWIGMNPITVYLAENIVNFHKLAERLAGGSVEAFLNRTLGSGAGDAILAALTLGIAIAFCRFLYQRKIFLRL
jgi:predicted acyltransferase